MELSNIEPQDAGDFVCQISLKAGETLEIAHTVEVLGKVKVIHPKYYKHLREATHSSHLGRLLSLLIHQVKQNFKQYNNIDFNSEISSQFIIYFHPTT